MPPQPHFLQPSLSPAPAHHSVLECHFPSFISSNTQTLFGHREVAWNTLSSLFKWSAPSHFLGFCWGVTYREGFSWPSVDSGSLLLMFITGSFIASFIAHNLSLFISLFDCLWQPVWLATMWPPWGWGSWFSVLSTEHRACTVFVLNKYLWNTWTSGSGLLLLNLVVMVTVYYCSLWTSLFIMKIPFIHQIFEEHFSFLVLSKAYFL